MATLDRLIGLHLVAITQATDAYLAGGSLKSWQAAMEKAISTAYTATYIAATAERLGVPADSPLISRQRLSRAERADITKAIAEQIKYLQGFAGALDTMSPAQIAARASLYGPAIKAFYLAQRYGDWDIPSRLVPGNQQCGGRCLCDASVIDNQDGTGIWRRTMRGRAEVHCQECPQLEGDHPIQRKRAA